MLVSSHHDPRSGRAIIVALSIAVVAVVAISLFFALSGGDGNVPAGNVVPPPPPSENRAESADVEVGDTTNAEANTALTPTGKTTPEVATDAIAPLELRGVIRGNDGPISGALVRWIDVEPAHAILRQHDGLLSAAEIDPELVNDGGTRSVLVRAAKSAIDVKSDASGTFLLTVPASARAVSKNPGSLLAAADGHRIVVRSVENAAQGNPQPGVAVSVPDAADAPVSTDTDHVNVDFYLHFGAQITGHVTDASDRSPAAGMQVIAAEVDPNAPAIGAMSRSHGAPRATVRRDGSYEIYGIAAGHYRIFALSGETSYVTTTSEAAKKITLQSGERLEDVDLEVSLGGSISGVVTNVESVAVATANCKVIPTDFMESAVRGDIAQMTFLSDTEHASDLDGRYEIRGLPLEKSYRVSAQKEGFGPATSAAIKLTRAAPDANVDLELPVGLKISGQVLDEDGSPVERVRVHVAFDMRKVMNGELTAGRGDRSEEDGSFELKDLGPGTYELVANRDKVNPVMVFGSGEQRESVKVELVDADVTGVVIRVKNETASDVGTEGTIAGIVTDDTGAPVKRARVSSGAMFGGKSGKTDAEGRFLIEGLEGVEVNLSTTAKGHATGTTENVAVGSTEVRIVLERMALIVGKVVSAAGEPVVTGGKIRTEAAGSKENALERIARGQLQPDGGTDVGPNGTFSVQAPPGDDVEVIADLLGYAPSRAKVAHLEPGERREDVEITVRVGSLLRGHVVDENGRGIAGANVRLSSTEEDDSKYLEKLMPQMFGNARNTASTNDQGAYSLANLAPGTYKLAAEHKSFAPSEPVTVEIGDDNEVEANAIQLDAGNTISGIVVEKDKPVQRMMVQLMGDGVMKQSMSDEKGAFSFDGVGPGDYIVMAMDVTGMQTGKMKMRSLPVAIEDEDVRLKVTFGEGFSLKGKVEGLPSGPMRMLTLRRAGGPAPEELDPTDLKTSMKAARFQVGMGMVAPDGSYEITDLAPGEYILEAPRMPANPADLEAYKKSDRTPWIRETIKIEGRDVELDLKVRK